jgi:hypothetical protein
VLPGLKDTYLRVPSITLLVPDSWEKEQMPACNRRVAADYRSREGGPPEKKKRRKKNTTGCEIGCVVLRTTRGNAGHNQDPSSLADRGGAFGRRGEEMNTVLGEEDEMRKSGAGARYLLQAYCSMQATCKAVHLGIRNVMLLR